MEAARIAAERGHFVTLYQANDRLGGQVVVRPHLGRHIAWLERELERLGVEVHLGSEFDASYGPQGGGGSCRGEKVRDGHAAAGEPRRSPFPYGY